MTSACRFKDTLRNDTQVFLKFKDSIFEELFTSNQLELHSLLPIFIAAEQRCGKIKGNPAWWKWIIITRNTDHFLFPTPSIQLLQ